MPKGMSRTNHIRKIELRSYHKRARGFIAQGLTARGTPRRRARKLTVTQKRLYNRKKWHMHQLRVRINSAVSNCERMKAEATMRAMLHVASCK